MILEYTRLYKEETGVTLTVKDIPDVLVDMYRDSRKRNVAASKN